MGLSDIEQTAQDDSNDLSEDTVSPLEDVNTIHTKNQSRNHCFTIIGGSIEAKKISFLVHEFLSGNTAGTVPVLGTSDYQMGPFRRSTPV